MTDLSIQEIEALLDQHWEDTRKWDPMANGTTDREVEGLNPNVPGLSKTERDEIVAKRGAIYDRHKWAHEMMVGQRTANQVLRQRFRDATGTPDPVSEVFRQSYAKLQEFFEAGGSVDQLEFGPIEVVPDKVPPA